MFIFPMKCCHLGVMKPQFWGLNRQETRWDKPGSSGLGSVDPTWMVPKVQLDVYSPKYGNNRFNPCEFAIYIYIYTYHIYIYTYVSPFAQEKHIHRHIPYSQCAAIDFTGVMSHSPCARLRGWKKYTRCQFFF